MKKILNNICMIILLMILIFVMYAKWIRKDEIINFGGYRFFIVLTGSMEPEIQAGSLLMIKEEENYQVR